MELVLVTDLTLSLPVSPNHLRPPPSPAHSAADRSVTRLSPRFRYYSAVRLLARHRFPFRLSTYRVTFPGATRGPHEPSWGHALIFRTVPSANTLVRWVNENAFASIVQARPCPTFGRPVRHRGGPHRLRPGTSPHALRIPPHDGHPALRSSSSSGFRSTLAVSGFRLRARLGFSIPSAHSGQRGITPAFGYGAPHPSAGGTSTLLICALPSAHYAALRLPRLLRPRLRFPLPAAYLLGQALVLPIHSATGACACQRTGFGDGSPALRIRPETPEERQGPPGLLGCPLRARHGPTPRRIRSLLAPTSLREDPRRSRHRLQGKQNPRHPEQIVFEAVTPRLTRSRAYASPASLPRPAQGSLPARAGSPLAGRVSHPLDNKRNFMESSHPPIPIDQQSLVALFSLSPTS